jgi:TPR repeat protein
MSNYGFALQKECNGKPNLSEAMKYFRKSADSNDSIGNLLYYLSFFFESN